MATKIFCDLIAYRKLNMQSWSCHETIGLATLVTITGTNELIPYHLFKSQQIIDDQVPADKIYRCPIFMWIAVTWQTW